MTPHPFVIGILGDSISTGYNAASPGDNLSHSWASGVNSGEQGASHFTRLKRVMPTFDVQARNVAVAGARASDLAAQLGRLLPTKPDYVTLLIGANDITQWLFGEYGLSLQQFSTYVQTTIERLIEVNQRVMILLVAVPDQSQAVNHMLRRGSGQEFATQLSASPYLRQLTEAYRERAVRLNRALEEIATKFPGQVRFARSVAHARFSGEHLSHLDSYHPSVKGQQLLADLSWNEGFFP